MVGKNGGCFNPFVPQKAGVVTQKQSAAWGGGLCQTGVVAWLANEVQWADRRCNCGKDDGWAFAL